MNLQCRLQQVLIVSKFVKWLIIPLSRGLSSWWRRNFGQKAIYPSPEVLTEKKPVQLCYVPCLTVKQNSELEVWTLTYLQKHFVGVFLIYLCPGVFLITWTWPLSLSSFCFLSIMNLLIFMKILSSFQSTKREENKHCTSN